MEAKRHSGAKEAPNKRCAFGYFARCKYRFSQNTSAATFDLATGQTITENVARLLCNEW
jgi:hypothetical protein